MRAAVLHIPRASLALRPDHVELLLARPISTGSGSAAVLAAFLATLLEHGADCRHEEQSRMGTIALDLATACLTEQLRVLETGTDETRAQTLLRRVHGFIAQNLADPDLTPRTIARRHHISLRTLYGLFSRQPASVATVIRRGRLERCHADLARPDLRHLSVQVIASRWGFTNPSSFSRTFREAYGISPTEHRATASATAPPDRSAA
ncbi:helix-turn-helix domain-containing protein [Streptomyces sp. NPDC003863]